MGNPTGVRAGEEIIQGIRDQLVVRVGARTLEGSQYYADREGHIYSLHTPGEPKTIEAKEGGGLMWVALYNPDGKITRYMVGELIAETFLDDGNRQSGDDTVIYKDGNPRNNAVENLAWASRYEQRKQLRDIAEGADQNLTDQQDRSLELAERLAKVRSRGSEDAEVQLPIPKRKDTQREKKLDLEKKLQDAEDRIKVLEEAIAPFARFILSPKDRIAIGKSVMVESNKGTTEHSILTVHDFRVAAKAMQGDGQGEPDHG